MLELLLLLETREDKISFQELYENTYRRLIFVAQGIIHNWTDAEDIVHDVYTKVARDYPKYRNKSSSDMLSLCIVMTRNGCINTIRERERHKETPIAIREDLLGAEKDPLDGVLRKEDEAMLERALMKLDTEDKNILVLRYFHDMSYKDIGDLLDMRTKAVDMRLYRIKKKLREVMYNE